MEIEDVVNFYYKMAKLKDTLRSGPVQWKVEREVKETIASHVFGTLMLAIGLQSKLQLDLDFSKVLLMLAIHETEEVLIGDLTPLDTTRIDKKKLGESAVEQIFSVLSDGKVYIDLIKEFNDGKTKEAHFAKACDKFECVLEFKKYCDAGQTGVEKVTREMLQNEMLKDFVDKGYALEDIFYIYHMKQFEDLGFDEKLWYEKIKK